VHLTKLIISGKITQSGYAKFKRFKTISGPTEIGDLSLENLKQELVIDEVFLQRRQKDRGAECQETAERRFDFFLLHHNNYSVAWGDVGEVWT
jgi:hypothetical protein